jgi:hypothetical protein
MFVSIGVVELLVVLLIAAAIIWPSARICAKAGYLPWLGIAAVVPGANILLLWFLALTTCHRGERAPNSSQQPTRGRSLARRFRASRFVASPVSSAGM